MRLTAVCCSCSRPKSDWSSSTLSFSSLFSSYNTMSNIVVVSSYCIDQQESHAKRYQPAPMHLCCLILLEDHTNWINAALASLLVFLLWIIDNLHWTQHADHCIHKRIVLDHTSRSFSLCSFCNTSCFVCITSSSTAFFFNARVSLSLYRRWWHTERYINVARESTAPTVHALLNMYMYDTHTHTHAHLTPTPSHPPLYFFPTSPIIIIWKPQYWRLVRKSMHTISKKWHVGVLNTAKRKVLTTNMHSMVKAPEGLTMYVQEYQRFKT